MTLELERRISISPFKKKHDLGIVFGCEKYEKVIILDLFDYSSQKAANASRPLADKMRPRNLDEFVGQEHIVGEGTPIRRHRGVEKRLWPGYLPMKPVAILYIFLLYFRA
jgi:hypothetical protein